MDEQQKSTAITTTSQPVEGGGMVNFRKLYNEEALKIIRQNKCPGADDLTFAALMTIAAMKNLNPMTGQIHFVLRRQKNKQTDQWEEKWSPQVGIDGFRLQAARTGEYDGQDEPEFIYNDKGYLVLTKVRAYRKNISRPFVGVAHFDEYVQTYKDGAKYVPNHMWDSKPHIMLAKCAEALALRKAFPEELGDLHIPEEINDETAPPLAAKMSVPHGQPIMVQAPDPKAKSNVEIFTEKMRETSGPDTLELVGEEIHKANLSPQERKVLAEVYKARLHEFDNQGNEPVKT